MVQTLAIPVYTPPAFAERRLGAMNVIGLWTFYLKEVRRFAKVLGQTVLAPVVTTWLFMTVFAVAMGKGPDGAMRMVAGVPMAAFIGPGLIMMSVIQNAFANTQSSIMIAKVQGNIIDTVMAPLNAAELTLGYVGGGVTRGVLVAVASAVPMHLVIDLPMAHPLVAVAYILQASVMLSLLGILAGLWAEKFDQGAAVNNFVITPLSFLSGTFYSIDRLPGIWHTIAHLDPFFFLIDGLRYGYIGRADAPVLLGTAVCLALNAGLAVACYLLLRRGYRLQS